MHEYEPFPNKIKTYGIAIKNFIYKIWKIINNIIMVNMC